MPLHEESIGGYCPDAYSYPQFMNEAKTMKWLVHHRSEVQKTAHDLYLLIPKKKRPVKKHISLIHQDLVGVLFCLWRGVFLAHNKDSNPGDPLFNASAFLKKVIEDNAITFGDDKTFKEWTANFYVDCAGRILIGFPISTTGKATGRCETISPLWIVEDYPSDIKGRWEYNHKILKAKINSMKESGEMRRSTVSKSVSKGVGKVLGGVVAV